MNYKEDISIDPDALDVEWVRQPSLYYEYSVASARKKAEIETARQALDVCEAELQFSIRADPAKFGLDKVTETAVKAVIPLQSSHKQLSQRLGVLTEEAALIDAALRSLEHKKAALENLVRLHGQNYFAGPSVPRDLGAEMLKEKEQQTTKSAVAAALNPPASRRTR